MRGNMNMDVTPKWLQIIKVILSMKWLEHMTLQIRDTWVLICAVEVSMTQLNLKPAEYYESSENSAFWTIINEANIIMEQQYCKPARLLLGVLQ